MSVSGNEKRKVKKMQPNKRERLLTDEDINAIVTAVKSELSEMQKKARAMKRQETLYNTRLLMESYIELTKFVKNAISEESESHDKVLSIFRGENARLKSVQEAKMQTGMMLENIDRAITELEAEHREKGTVYKFEAFKKHYIYGFTFEQIAESLDCSKNSPERWSRSIMKQMAVKLFGVNGLM